MRSLQPRTLRALPREEALDVRPRDRPAALGEHAEVLLQVSLELPELAGHRRLDGERQRLEVLCGGVVSVAGVSVCGVWRVNVRVVWAKQRHSTGGVPCDCRLHGVPPPLLAKDVVARRVLGALLRVVGVEEDVLLRERAVQRKTPPAKAERLPPPAWEEQKAVSVPARIVLPFLVPWRRRCRLAAGRATCFCERTAGDRRVRAERTDDRSRGGRRWRGGRVLACTVLLQLHGTGVERRVSCKELAKQRLRRASRAKEDVRVAGELPTRKRGVGGVSNQSIGGRGTRNPTSGEEKQIETLK